MSETLPANSKENTAPTDNHTCDDMELAVNSIPVWEGTDNGPTTVDPMDLVIAHDRPQHWTTLNAKLKTNFMDREISTFVDTSRRYNSEKGGYDMRFKVSISTQYVITINHGHTSDIVLSDEEQTNDAASPNHTVHFNWQLTAGYC